MDFCEMKAYQVYVLGMKDKENKKANLGSAVHKALELFGRLKISDPNRKTIDDDELGRIKKEDCTVENLAEIALAHYEEKTDGLVGGKKDLETCIEWVNRAITEYNGELDPRNQNIVNVEEFFDIELQQDWAKYEYEVDGQIIKGRLHIRGTVDVIISEGDNLFRILDYKTGRRYDWGKDKIKHPDDFKNDKQLLFYFYAMRNKYKDEKRDFYVSIYYINDHVIDGEIVPGGIFDVVFDDSDYDRAEKMVREQFERIKNAVRPKQLSSKCTHWKCKSLCNFSQIIPEISLEKPACMALTEMIKEEGIDAVTSKFIDLEKSMNYQDGGGRSADTEKEHKKQ
jgi:hypothetical protein